MAVISFMWLSLPNRKVEYKTYRVSVKCWSKLTHKCHRKTNTALPDRYCAGERAIVRGCSRGKWLRLSLPFQLNHINVWLLREADGWTLVDTGVFSETTREIWHGVLEDQLDGAPLVRILVTHLHPDHVGCAGWLARRFDVELFIRRATNTCCAGSW